MKRQFLTKALTFGLSATALVLAGCSTVESRISENPGLFQSLSPRDQQLVQQGQIRSGMSQNGVWLAWGSPDRKTVGSMRGTATETWIYLQGTTGYGGYGYPYGGYGHPYGPYGYGGPWGFGHISFGAVGGAMRSHGGHGGHGRFVFFGDPFYDPFYYSYIPPTVYYPYKIVTFSNGRVASFQFLVPPYR
jgi:hypothetical protein